MADTKITSLQPPQVGYPVVPATDVLPIVVIADPGMATSGSTRKITVNQLLGAGGTATLASATITGDLTVRTNKLKVDATGVAIGAATAGYPLDVTGISRFIGDAYLFSTTGGAAFSKSLIFGSAANISAASIYGQTASANSGILYLATQTGGVMTDRLSIDSSGVFTFQNVGGAGTAMTLNSTGLGVGVASPAYKLDVLGTGNAGIMAVTTNAQVSSLRLRQTQNLGANTRNWEIRTNSVAYGNLEFAVGASQQSDTYTAAMVLDASGRVLVGNTSAFTDLTGSKEVRIGESGMQTFSIAPLPAATATDIARGGVGGLVYVGGYNGTGQYGAVVLWTAVSATVVSVINGTGSTITFSVVSGYLKITSSLALTQVTAACIRI